MVSQHSPLGRLPAALVRLRLLRLLAQSRRAIRVLLAHCALVRQVARAVHNHNEGANDRPVDRHVGILVVSAESHMKYILQYSQMPAEWVLLLKAVIVAMLSYCRVVEP